MIKSVFSVIFYCAVPSVSSQNSIEDSTALP